MIFLKFKIRFIYVGVKCKRKKWGKKCLEIMSIKGGGGGEGQGGPKPNGKNHLKFPFLLLEPFHKKNYRSVRNTYGFVISSITN